MSKKPDNNNVERVFDGGKRKMEVITKILIALAGVGVVAGIAYGVSSLDAAKQAETMQASQAVQIEVNDFTTKTETEKVVDMTLQYQEEAEQLWKENGDKLVCDKQTFVDKYITYRKDNGLSKEQAYNSLYNEFAKENQITVNEQGEVVAEVTEMDVVINSADDNIEEEIVEQPEVIEEAEVVDFVVEEITPTQLYSTVAVNVRSGPDAQDFEKIGALKAEQRVTVVGVVKQYKEETVLWYKLEGSKGNTGFVSGAYLVEKLPEKVVETPAPTQPSHPAPSQPSSGGSLSKDDIMSKLGGLGANGGMGGMTNGGQASADSGYTGNVQLQ